MAIEKVEPSMRMTQLVPDGAIIPRLSGTQRDEVIAELVDALIAAGAASAKLRDELIRAVLERERRGSTGFGRGVAVPHVKHKSVKTMAASIGLSDRGVDFNALDKQPVYSIFLLLSPEDRPEEHLHAMEVIFKNLSKDTFRRFLRQAASVDDVRTLLEEADNQLLAS
jgi:mannitol/fructose-specific phosphotransferase system IIA component (Ntr-type)